MRNFFLFVFFAATSIAVNAQTFTISGKLVDEKNIPAPDATIFLLTKDSVFKKGTSSNEAGIFTFDGLQGNSSYLVKIAYIGYEPVFRSVTLLNAGTDLGTIRLIPNSQTLKQVEIKGTIPLATQSGDTTNYSAGAYKVNKDATAEELVTKMPGVTITDGKVQAQGEDVKQVLVDGKVFFGDDANTVLKNLPAEVVDKIQVFDKKSDQAQFTGVDDGNTSKTINIVTKPQFRNGTFGKVVAGYGIEDKYKVGGNVNVFKGNRRISILAQTNNVNEQNFSSEDLVGVMSSNSNSGGQGSGGRGMGGPGGRGQGGPGGQNPADNFLVNNAGGINTPTAFGINYIDKWGKKTEVSGSYFFNTSKNKTESNLFQQYVLGSNSGLIYSEKNNSGYTNQNHRLNLKFETKLDSFNSIIIQPRLSFQLNDGNKSLLGLSSQNGINLSSTSNTSTSGLFGYSISTPILYRHAFAKRGRTFSINTSPSFTRNTGEGKLYTMNTYHTDTLVIGDTVDQSSNTFKSTNAINNNVTYTEPLSKFTFLSITYTNSYSESYSSRKTYTRDEVSDAYAVLDSFYTNVFRSNYKTQSGSVGFRIQKDKVNFFVNAAYQWARLGKTGEIPVLDASSRTFTSLLPSAMFMYKINDQRNLRAFYRSNNNAPSIDQLQSVVNNSNSLQLTTGNPDLKQDFQQNLVVRYSDINTKKATSFFAMIGGNYSSNYIGNSVVIASRDTVVYSDVVLQSGSQVQRPVNLDGYYNLRSFINYAFPVKKIKTNISLNVSGNITRVPGLINNQVNYASTSNGSLGVVLSSNISEKVDFLISSNSSYSNIINTLQTANNNNYFSQNSKAKISVNPTKRIVVQTEFTNQRYNGLSSSFNQSISLWNAGIGYKFMKNNQAEFRVIVYDLLNQNRSIQRTNTESYIQDIQTNVLTRYYMLTFTYNFRKYLTPNGSTTPKK